MKKTVVIVALAALVIVAGAMIFMKASVGRVAKNFEQAINDYLENAKKNSDIVSYRPFKCSGFNKVVCKSDYVSFYLYGASSDADINLLEPYDNITAYPEGAVSTKDIVFVAGGSKKKIDAEIKGKSYIGKEFDSDFMYKINAVFKPSSETVNLSVSYISDSAYNNGKTNNSFKSTLRHPFFAKEDIFQIKDAWFEAKKSETEFTNQIGMIGYRLDNAEINLKSDNLYDNTRRIFSYYGIDMDVYVRELSYMKNMFAADIDKDFGGDSFMKDTVSLLDVLENVIKGKYNAIKVSIRTKDEYANDMIYLNDINIFNAINYLDRLKVDSQGFEK